MKRLVCLALVCLTVLLLFHTRNIQKERHHVELLLWIEFDAALSGLIRMLRLAEVAANPLGSEAQSALLAAYEHSLTVRRLGPAAEELLGRRGVAPEPLAGYLLSLTGGVASVCDDARRQGTADRVWMGELRRRLQSIHEALNIHMLDTLSRSALQERIDALFGADPASSYFTVAATPAPACW